VVAKGKELFDSVGCRACHAITPDEVATPLGASKDWGPNLGKVAQKESGRFIYWWIKDPRGYNPRSRMPSLRLGDDEARALTSYLLSLSPPAATDAPTTGPPFVALVTRPVREPFEVVLGAACETHDLADLSAPAPGRRRD
jgi:mono/diheme cytochrome c family protein